MASASLPPGHLAPPLFTSTKSFVDSGRTLSCTLSPRASCICIFPTKNKSGELTHQYESNVYIAGPEAFPLRSQLVSDSSVQYVKTREFFKNEKILPDQYRPFLPETLEGYSMTIKGHLRRLNEAGCGQSVLEHYQSLDATFDLFLLLTAGKSAPGIFGEDLLDWLNRHYISPTSEEGIRLADQEQPWKDSQFWSVLVRYTLRGIVPPLQHFVGLLTSHSSPYLASLSKRFLSLLNNFPRAPSVSRSMFSRLRREWVQQVASFRTELDGVPHSAKSESWWSHLSDMIAIFEGDELVIKRIGREFGLGWLEVVCVWGVWREPMMERESLLDLAPDIYSDIPPFPEEIEDRILKHLFKNNSSKVVECCMGLDAWLGAHLADIMQAEGLLDNSASEGSELSLRDECILTYAETILNDPGQWMVAVDYMQSCGQIGLRTADEILLRVNLDFDSKTTVSSLDWRNPHKHVEEVQDTVIPIHLVRFCQEHERGWVLDGVIRSAARSLAELGRLPEALAYAISANDWMGVEHIVMLCMEQFQRRGPASLIQLINALPSTIVSTYQTPGRKKWQYLTFLLTYGHFHSLVDKGDLVLAASCLGGMYRDDVIPLEWKETLFEDARILLENEDTYFTESEAMTILRHLENFETGYSGWRKPTKAGNEIANLGAARIALAKYFARLALR